MSESKKHTDDPRRHLASVSNILEDERIQGMIRGHSRPMVLNAVDSVLARLRDELKPGDPAPGLDEIVALVGAELDEFEAGGYKPEVIEKVLYKNAIRLFNLKIE